MKPRPDHRYVRMLRRDYCQTAVANVSYVNQGRTRCAGAHARSVEAVNERDIPVESVPTAARRQEHPYRIGKEIIKGITADFRIVMRRFVGAP